MSRTTESNPEVVTVTVRHPGARPGISKLKLRLFLTCWLVYALHFSPYVYRELYLTMSIAEKHSIQVWDYVDLHPDLFVMEGRGAFLGHNPGTSILAAIPYKLLLPIVNRVAPVRPPSPEEARVEYNNPYPDRQEFYKKVRERGLDKHLGAAAAVTAVFFMAPLTALSVVVMFVLLRRSKFSERLSLWLGLLYAFGTPVFFRTAMISLNLVVALLGLFALALVWWPERNGIGERWRYVTAGLIAGYTVVTDYTGLITIGALTVLAFWLQKQQRAFWPSLTRTLWFVGATVPPILFMLGWQWYCYGSPWSPAQFVMPKKFFTGYPSERGVGWPLPEALWTLIFEPRYGFLVFAPIFALVVWHLVMLRRKQNRVPAPLAAFAWLHFVTLYIFCSCIHYTVRFQFQDGFRYMVPIVPFLFLLLADVLTRLPRVVVFFLATIAVAETWMLSMVREAPLESFTRVLFGGFELPWLTTLVRSAPQYMPWLAGGASPLPLFLLAAVAMWGIWAFRDPGSPLLADEPSTGDNA